MIGPLDEEECALDPWGGLAGSRDSLEALQLRLRRLVWCLDSDADSLALLDKLCAGQRPLTDLRISITMVERLVLVQLCFALYVCVYRVLHCAALRHAGYCCAALRCVALGR